MVVRSEQTVGSRHCRLRRVALNIGGIANLTAISPGATPDQVIVFATGARRGVILGKITPQVDSFPQANLLLPRTGARTGCGRTGV